MSSQLRVGRTYHEGTKVKWTIKDFGGQLARAGQSIQSPRFFLQGPAQNLRSFHLEMEIPNKNPGTNCPVYLIRDDAGQIVTMASLECPPIKNIVLDQARVFKVTLEHYPFVLMSSTVKMLVSIITLPCPYSGFPYNQIFNETHLPDEMIIMLQVEQRV